MAPYQSLLDIYQAKDAWHGHFKLRSNQIIDYSMNINANHPLPIAYYI